MIVFLPFTIDINNAALSRNEARMRFMIDGAASAVTAPPEAEGPAMAGRDRDGDAKVCAMLSDQDKMVYGDDIELWTFCHRLMSQLPNPVFVLLFLHHFQCLHRAPYCMGQIALCRTLRHYRGPGPPWPTLRFPVVLSLRTLHRQS